LISYNIFNRLYASLVYQLARVELSHNALYFIWLGILLYDIDLCNYLGQFRTEIFHFLCIRIIPITFLWIPCDDVHVHFRLDFCWNPVLHMYRLWSVVNSRKRPPHSFLLPYQYLPITIFRSVSLLPIFEFHSPVTMIMFVFSSVSSTLFMRPERPLLIMQI